MSRRRTSAPRGGLLTALLAAAFLVGTAGALSAERFSFSGDSTSMTLAEGEEHAVLTGHGRVESQDLRITADTIELFGKDFIYAQAHGNVHVVDAQRGLDLTAQELFYDRDNKIARVRGNATLADLKNEMVVKGGFIEDRDKEQIDIIQIGVRIFHKDIVCRAEFARYQRDKKILELSGLPWVSKGDDVYQAARITVNLDTEDITLEGSVQGTLQDKGSSSGTPAAAGTGSAAPQKTPDVPPGAPPLSSPSEGSATAPAGQRPAASGPSDATGSDVPATAPPTPGTSSQGSSSGS